MKRNLDEMDKLEQYLKTAGIRYRRVDKDDTRVSDLEGSTEFGEWHQISVFDENDDWVWDVSCHNGTYGCDEGLLEYWSKKLSETENDVRGWLTANDVIQILNDSQSS